MKHKSDFISFLIFLVVLVVLLWIMPDQKVESIGDFFEKIVKPLSWPLSAIIIGWLGIDKYLRLKSNKKEKSP